MSTAEANIVWTAFVEGKGDLRFLKCLMRHVGISGVALEVIGGVSALGKVSQQIHRKHDSGHRITVILDANSDPEGRREEFNRVQAKHALPVECLFLVPNDREPGSLETLLEQAAVSGHRAIYGCLDAYERCLKAGCKSYRGPQPKGRVYAYCEALGIDTHVDKRQYDNQAYWNLDAPALEPLKNFLAGLRR